ncbi:uncharacterized protein LOC120629987 [Pararge aegeria]|uniref:Jg8900 protein n=1 Tax=Pararge aegeria aegeria TaxID=348720 RepID=A0A8S4SJJ1_9NEOP|nr:uncharacterized protein LOC120629987 [Pararge aegeria]CAH2266839.1 jg8900 [Pararge aegeria aegeria]
MFSTKCYILLCFATYFVAKSDASVVPFINPCAPNDQKCILLSGKAALPHLTAGLPELGIPVIDPIKIDSVRSDGNSLKLGFRNIQITGVKKCKMTELGRNPEKHTMKMTVECPLYGSGQYDLKGKLGFIEAYGDGDFEMHTEKVRITVEIKIKDIQKKGEKYWKVTGYDYSYELIEKVFIKLKNLFDGDEKRAKPFVQFLDNSWKEVIEEVGGPLINQVIGVYVDLVKTLFLKVPTKDLEVS